MPSLSSNIAHLTPEVIASWPTPNYDDPDRKTFMPVYSSIWFGVATIMVAMRYWLRLRGHAGRLGLDDAILLPAWMAGLMFTVVSIAYTQWAQGDRHVWDILAEKRTDAVLCMWLGQFSFLICGGCTKVSILFFYRRLVEGTYSKRWNWLVWFAIGFTIAYTVAFCIILCVNCSPTEAYWMAFDIKYALTENFTCLDTSVINTMAGVCAAISDLYAVALPCIITWHYAIPRRQKIALNIIFSLGFVVVAASGVRTYWLITTGTSKDVSRSAFNLFVWAQFELQVGIMCASAPSLRVFFRRYLGGSQATRNTTNKTITVVRDTTVTFKQDPSSQPPAPEKPTGRTSKNVHEMHAFATDGSEDGLSSPSRSQERLTRYSHEEDAFVMSDLSWKDPTGQPRMPVAARMKGGHF